MLLWSRVYHLDHFYLDMTFDLISRGFVSGTYLLRVYYNQLSSNVSYAKPIPLRIFVTLLCFLFNMGLSSNFLPSVPLFVSLSTICIYVRLSAAAIAKSVKPCIVILLERTLTQSP